VPKRINPALFVKKAVPATTEKYESKNQFNDFLVCDELKRNIGYKGYTSPTPIQDAAIPALLEGRDVLGIANTGTGKTAAFLIPLINKIFKDKSQKVLIIVPTRELVTQIEKEIRDFANGMGIYSAICIGGVGIGGQIYALRRNPNFVIGTPGRLCDLAERRAVNFHDYQTIVLDEVDRMLDMGFIHDIKDIILSLPQVRQSLFFSATMPTNVFEIKRDFLKNPVEITIKSIQPAENVDQDIVRVNGKPKVDMLHELLIKDGFDKVLVFGRTKFGIEKLADELLKRGFKVGAIHGNKRQSQRQRILDEFKTNQIKILLATDVAARGLDIENVTHVINYDEPESYSDYIHRIGRTGRANKSGVALTFVG
jgi:superfamily II DNA/RNA helicase